MERTTALDLVADDRRDELEDLVSNLLSELTIEAKVGQLVQQSGDFATGTPVDELDADSAVAEGLVGSMLNVTSIEHARALQEQAVEESPHGVPLLFALDVIHGHRTIFPIPLAEASSWNLELIERSARVAATEAAAVGVHWNFAPSVDVARDPRWGRVMEAAGEDPYLGSAVARARVRGFQGEDVTAEDTVLACAKHYVGYGASEAGREYNTVDVSDTTLREVHLPPFAACVDEGVATVMNAFNVHERIPASGSRYLVDEVLRGELGFDGMVVSDWDSFGEMAIHGAAADKREAAKRAIEAGSDVDMVGGTYADHLAALVESGDVDEERLDAAVRRVLELKAAIGLFDDPYRYFDEERAEAAILAGEHREAARAVARESQVLLQNEGDLLPLDSASKIALVGEHADSARDMIGFWAFHGQPEDVVTLRDELEERLGDALTYATGCTRDGTATPEDRQAAVEAAADADVVIAAVGEPSEWTGEGASRTRLGLPGDQRELLEALVETGTPVVAVVFSGRPLAIEWEAEHVPAILQAWFPGVEAGPAVADVLYGDCDASGRLPMTVPRTVGQVPIYYNHLSTGRPVPDHVDQSRPPEDPLDRFVSRYIDCPTGPLYPFGHGESYADLAYGDVTCSAKTIGFDETLTVRTTVENVGDRAGTTVVQCYVRDEAGSRARPVRELKAFEKVELGPGEAVEVAFELTSDDLAFWTADEEWVAEPGAFTVEIGRSSADVADSAAFELTE